MLAMDGDNLASASLDVPLLRAPPFPGVAANVAAVSGVRLRPLAGAPTASDLERADRLTKAIARERVGGAFWNRRRDPWGEAGLSTEEGRLLNLLCATHSGNATAMSSDGRKELAYRLLLENAEYRDPFTDRPCSPEAAVALLGFWRAHLERNPGYGGRQVVAAGIASWKRREVAQLLWAGEESQLDFAISAKQALKDAKAVNAAIIAWPARTAPDLPRKAAAEAIPYYQVEDGFIRSIGLGAECHPPFSIVLDRSGAHYDPTKPSDLENLLKTTIFCPELIARAEDLISLIVQSRISKYEAGGKSDLPERTRRRILVTGQVEDDLSVMLGGNGITSNLELLRRAREMEPDAEIWFKPHPDVDAGHRKGAVADTSILEHADLIIRDTAISDLFDAIDAIHVLTSLAGFEALLRGVEVVAHGTPFYAGWGLTRDLGEVPERRGRQLSLRELTAGVLLLYPHYLDPVTHLPCTPEVLINRLSAQKSPQRTWLTRLRNLQGRARRMASELKLK